MPFMRMASGHQHVANTLMNELEKCPGHIDCHKIDILSYSYGNLEKLIVATYLAWIKFLPSMYHRLYVRMSYQKSNQRHILYETLFHTYFKKLLADKKPNILFFTHSLPSNIASQLKEKQMLDSTTVNVYTDFFVNSVWGKAGIDYHFVPSLTVKDYLIEQGVPADRIYLTGIPVDRIFTNHDRVHRNTNQRSLLVSGGNLGIGAVEKILTAAKDSKTFHYYILCGKNKVLYNRLKGMNLSSITPLPYIYSKTRMNELYNEVDGVITKPGGVTVSECLMKKKPIFMIDPLPGQERINEYQLKRLGLAIPLDTKETNLEKQLLHFFQNESIQKRYESRVYRYHQHLDKRPLQLIIEEILN